MKILLLLVMVNCAVLGEDADRFWNPLNSFIDNMSKKTQEVQQFMADQESQFLENVTNKTKQIQEYVTDQGKNVESSLDSYSQSLKDSNEKFISYLKDSEQKLSIDFERYTKLQDSTEKILNGAWLGASETEADLIALPEAELSVPGMIAAHGYPCESHTVRTDDGYILTLHRIPRGVIAPLGDVPSKTVLLHHGLFASSADWVFTGPEKGLGYLLADAGYDVWLANARGNRYSREHAWLRTDTHRYWDFSWHDIAQHDLPAVVDYIIRQKGSDAKINYIGHSMGTTILFALLSTKPEYNEKLHAGFALAPVVYTSEIRSPIAMLAPYASDVGYVSTLVGSKEFMPKKPGHGFLGSDACGSGYLDSAPCEHFLFTLCGFDEQQLNRTLLPVFLSHIGSGTSTKTVVHFAQEMSAGGRFQQFDYGLLRNMNVYGSPLPPEYTFENVTLPIALFSSKNDWLSSEKDVLKLYGKLRQQKEHYSVPLESFNHLDFLWAKDISELLYQKLFEVLDRWNEADDNETAFHIRLNL